MLCSRIDFRIFQRTTYYNCYILIKNQSTVIIFPIILCKGQRLYFKLFTHLTACSRYIKICKDFSVTRII